MAPTKQKAPPKKKTSPTKTTQRQNSGANQRQNPGNAQQHNSNPGTQQENWKERERNPQPMLRLTSASMMTWKNPSN